MKKNTSNYEKTKKNSFWIAFFAGLTISFVSNHTSIPVTILVALGLYFLYNHFSTTNSKLNQSN